LEHSSLRSEIWGFRDVALGGVGLVGFDVEATDGPVGKVDDATNELAGGLLVVDTGPRIFGRKVVVPPDLVARVDAGNGVIFLERGRDEIKDAPAYRPGRTTNEAYDAVLEAYYHAPSPMRAAEPRELARPG
jgi:hypothetical protein